MSDSNDKPYLKYRDRFKLFGILSIAANAVLAVTAIIVLFVPMFEIDLIITSEWFSLFNEIIYPFEGGFSEGFAFIILGGIEFIAAAAMLVVSVIKGISELINPDNFALKRYDDLKKRNSTGIVMKKAKNFYAGGQIGLLVSGLFFIVMGILFNRAFAGDYGDETRITGYFALCTGVNGLIAFAVIFILGYIVLSIAASAIRGKIETEIIKKEYEVEKNSTENNGSSDR